MVWVWCGCDNVGVVRFWLSVALGRPCGGRPVAMVAERSRVLPSEVEALGFYRPTRTIFPTHKLIGILKVGDAHGGAIPQ